jgi:ABC-type uncharacterized transport system substrate-binding protein
VFMGFPSDHPETQTRMAGLLQGLEAFGWTIGRNASIDWRWYNGNDERARRDASDLVALAPDVLVADVGPTLTALQQVTRTVPIVFKGVNDPVGAGYVASLARPGGNATGFVNLDFRTCSKWLELLKEIAPRLRRAIVLRTANIGGGSQFGAIQGVAPALGIELQPLDPRDGNEIEHAIASFARESDSGIIVTASTLAFLHRELIVALAAKHRLPAVYSSRYWVENGGLVSFGSTIGPELYRRVAGYVDRILKGESPADMPVQMPTRYEMVLNLKTAKALGIEVPPAVLLRADEVIE